MVQVHRVVRRGWRVGSVRIHVQHPQEEPIVLVAIHEVQRCLDRRFANRPRHRVGADPLGLVVEALEHVKPLVEAGGLRRVGLELVYDGVAHEPTGCEAVGAEQFGERGEALRQPAPDLVHTVAGGQPAGHERGDAGRRLGQGSDGVRVAHAPGSHRVDVGGSRDAAVAAEVVDPRRVQVDDDDAPDVVAGRGIRPARQRQHQDHDRKRRGQEQDQLPTSCHAVPPRGYRSK